ncbi:MAG: hemerythrin domain-containing protein [Sciscionella sp.]
MADVVELILADHRRFEELLRDLRNIEADRPSLRSQLAELLVAHAEAEELHVYPQLRKKAADDEEIEHGEKEHTEINQALLAFLELEDTSSEEYDEKLEELSETVNHHTNEEEQTLLNDARENLPGAERFRLGEAFGSERKRQMDTNCGTVENLRYVLNKQQGKVDS